MFETTECLYTLRGTRPRRIDFASGFPPRRLGANKKSNWTSGRRNSSPEHAIYPQEAGKKVKGNFVTFRSEVTWACWLVFGEPGCVGWFLGSHGVLAGFYGARVCWLVFTERGCVGCFLLSEGALAGFRRFS